MYSIAGSTQCDECGGKFTSMRNLRIHKMSTHPKPGQELPICEHCGEVAIEKHKHCPHCDYKSISSQKVKWHIDNRHPDTGTHQFFCELCGKGFIYESSYGQHKSEHKRRNPRKP